MKNSVLFKEMNDHEYTQCLKTLKAAEKKYKKDALILSAGDTTTKFGLVLDGSVTVESNDIWGNRTILSHVGKGQFFAETYALLEDEVLLVDVRANENCRVRFFTIGSLKNLRQINEPWAIKFISTEFDIPFDRQQLADYLNVDRSALSNELSKLQNTDIIKFRKNHFILLNGEADEQ
nr:Crp/Fnr family transcriptional regulator [uncultured Ruminococcus sp.]